MFSLFYIITIYTIKQVGTRFHYTKVCQLQLDWTYTIYKRFELNSFGHYRVPGQVGRFQNLKCSSLKET